MPASRILSPSIPLCLLLLLGLSSLDLTGCNDGRRQQIDYQLQSLSTQTDQLNQRLSDQQSLLEATKQRLQVENAQLNEYNASVQGYMLQHKTAVAVIAAGLAGAGTTLASDNQFSEQAKEVGTIVAVGALLWAASNMDEVTEVFNNLNQADAHAKTLKADIAQAAASIQQQTAAVQQSQQRLDLLAQRTAALQHQRDQL
jgi:hypothetical protein